MPGHGPSRRNYQDQDQDLKKENKRNKIAIFIKGDYSINAQQLLNLYIPAHIVTKTTWRTVVVIRSQHEDVNKARAFISSSNLEPLLIRPEHAPWIAGC